MRKLQLLMLTLIALLATPIVTLAQNGVWTSVCSAGATIDEAALRIYATDAADLFFASGKTGQINARYSVVNTSNAFGTQTPAWTTMELGYTDTSASGSVQAFLSEVDPCTGERVIFCSITSSDDGTNCKTCTFPSNSFDFLNKLYFVGVVINRTSTQANPIAHTLRIF